MRCYPGQCPAEQTSGGLAFGFIVDGGHFGVVLEPVQDARDQQVTLGGKHQLAHLLPDTGTSVSQGVGDVNIHLGA
jgi:hypothetical protein